MLARTPGGDRWRMSLGALVVHPRPRPLAPPRASQYPPPMLWRTLALMLISMLFGCGPGMVELRPTQSCDGNNLEACRQQCDEGVPRACYRLGWFYETGHSVRASPKTAVELYEKACNAGWAVACRALGNLYWYDESVKRQPKKAVGFYQKACDLGIVAVCPDEAMLAEAEGRKQRPGFGVNANLSVGGSVKGSGEAGTPDAPSAPTPQAPQAPVPQPPTAPTPLD
jgi:hypothetical protein